ncbi:unnamed protein product [Orchesella dallaii]
MPGVSRGAYGMRALGLGGLGGAIGAGIGALDGPVRAAQLGAAGGAIGGMVGGALEQQGTVFTMLGATAGGYVGGFVGGLLGGATGSVADVVLTALSTTAFAALGCAYGHDTFGVPGAVAGTLGGAVVGNGIGLYIVGPAAVIATGGIVGLVSGGSGSYFGAQMAAPTPDPSEVD